MNADSIISRANDISNGATTISSVLRSLNSIVSRSMSSSEIRERYTNGFYNTSSSIYTPKVYSKMFDEPTYLTFRIEFDFRPDKEENITSVKYSRSSDLVASVYPENITVSLFNNLENNKTIYNSNNQKKDYSYNKTVVNEGFNKMPEPLLSYDKDKNNEYYSTANYLNDNLGEYYRSKLLKDFINGLKDIQDNYPYYFTSIEGLNTLTKVTPEQGIRINSENSTITIKCLEGLDLKITSLMQMYRKIAWDDVYQRWILPDMMRYFGINIYVSEIRLFHSYAIPNKIRPGVYDFDTNFMNSSTLTDAKPSLLSKAGNLLNSAIATSVRLVGNNNNVVNGISAADSIIDAIISVNSAVKSNAYKLCDNAINDFMPTIKYECHMCEFDISDSNEHISSLSSAKSGIASPEPTIKIKIGNVTEKMVFPLQSGSLNINSYKGTYQYNDYVNAISDDDLQNEATWRRPHDAQETGSYDISQIATKSKNQAITNKRNRINSKYGELVTNEDYIQMQIPANSAMQSLIQGSLNYAFDKTDLSNLSTATTKSDDKNIPVNVYTNSKNSISNKSNRKYNPLANLNNNIQKYALNMYDDTLIAKFPQNVTNKNILTASVALSNVIKNIYDGQTINSAGFDASTKANVSENVFIKVLDKLSNSTATDPDSTAVKVLAKMILSEYNTSNPTSKNASKNKISELN